MKKKNKDKLDKEDLWTLAAIFGVNILSLCIALRLFSYEMGCDVPNSEIVVDDTDDLDTWFHYNLENNTVLLQAKQIEDITSFEALNAYLEGSITFHTEVTEIDDYEERTLWIEADREKSRKVIPRILYQKINTLIQQYQCNHLILYNLGNEIDFSKLNISNIPWLTLDNLQKEFQYTPFSNLNYAQLDIKMPLTEPLKNWLSHLDLHQTNLNLIDWNRLYTDSCATEISYLEFLVQENVDLSEATLSIELVDPTSSDLCLIEQINARQIYFGYCLFHPPVDDEFINLDFHLNPNIEHFFIDFSALVDHYDFTLGNIRIDSKNSNLLFGIRSTLDCNLKITEETVMELPDCTSLALHSCKCTSGKFLETLTNINKLSGILHIGDTFVNIAYQKEGERTLEEIKQEIQEAIGFSYTK